jgi:tRNA threonylcarbamoyladenosine biosynthesis protein TsaB
VLVVGFDTATPAVSAALHDGERIVGSALTVDARRHGELLAPMVAEVMADAGVDRADLTAVAVGVGPGPYTGLRVGLVTARVLGTVLGIPVHGVCTLDIIAAEAAKTRAAGFLVATDARRKEVYWARYDAAGRRVEGPLVGPAAEIPGARELAVAGAGGALYPAAFGELLEPAHPDARTLCEIVARGGPTMPPEPLYLRRPDAREPGAPKRVTPP